MNELPDVACVPASSRKVPTGVRGRWDAEIVIRRQREKFDIRNRSRYDSRTGGGERNAASEWTPRETNHGRAPERPATRFLRHTLPRPPGDGGRSPIQETVIESNPYTPPQASDAAESPEANAIRKIRPSTTGLILMLSVQSFGYAVAGVVALGALALREPVDATLFGVCFAVIHFFAMLYMIRSMRRVRRLQDLRNGRVAAGLACIPFVSPAIWIGIPLGIWLSVILSKQDVAAAFHSANKTDGEPSIAREIAGGRFGNG